MTTRVETDKDFFDLKDISELLRKWMVANSKEVRLTSTVQVLEKLAREFEELE
jgi:hypothetical protein